MVGPHAIVLLLAAYAFLNVGFPDDPARPARWEAWTWRNASTASAECQVLESYFGQPELLTGSGRTPEELERWIAAYGKHCHQAPNRAQ
jgi:hypothetical protein